MQAIADRRKFNPRFLPFSASTRTQPVKCRSISDPAALTRGEAAAFSQLHAHSSQVWYSRLALASLGSPSLPKRADKGDTVDFLIFNLGPSETHHIVFSFGYVVKTLVRQLLELRLTT